ncbi:MAG: hypothetical protein HOP19_00645 [Acidobacteria bacterium]|nr:hypothetical protein [Acidobacteriota bacterium]
MRLQHLYYASSRKYTEFLVATLAALTALMLLAAIDNPVAAQDVPPAVKALAAVSAASFRANEIAPESIVAAFGTDLATAARLNESWPLPLTLEGTSVQVRDAAGLESYAPLFFVAPGQVNFYLPSGLALGEARVTITSGDGAVSVGAINVAAVSPGLFAMNGNGEGVAAASVLRVRGSAHYTEIMARYDLDMRQWVTLPIEFGTVVDRVFVALFGTGIRGRSSVTEVTATLGGEPVAVLYAGAQGTMFGVDQVNIEIPRAVAGRGDMDFVLTVNGKAANAVRISVK